MESQPSVSVIIPTCNSEPWLAKLLLMVAAQTLVPVEVIIVDSESTDATKKIARCHNVHLIEIARQEFDHGGTRSLAGEAAVGEFLVYMTQDAIPVDENALARILRPLQENKTVAAAYGRQLPHEDANIFSEHLRSFNYPDQSEVRCLKDREQFGFKTIFISNSFAAYRKSVLAAHGFFRDHLLFGEDTLTVAKLLENGYCVAYVSEAGVYHSHNYSIVQDFKRYFDIGVFHVDQACQLQKFGGPGGAGRKYVRSEIDLLIARKKFGLLPESLLRNCGKYIAYNLGKRYRMLPRHWARALSMNRNWWS